MKKLAIVVPVWNNYRFTKSCIKDLSKLPEDHKLIVVDNGSTDETKNLKTNKQYEVLHLEENKGFAGGTNAGFSHAVKLGYQNVMFLNNDIKVFGNPDSWTLPLIAKAEKGGVVGPTAGCLDDGFKFICEAPKWPTRGFGYLSGWCIVASVETWQKLILEGEDGPFSTENFMYFEDTDLSFRAKTLGIELSLVPIPVKHYGRASSKKLNLNLLYTKSRKNFLTAWENETEKLKKVKYGRF